MCGGGEGDKRKMRSSLSMSVANRNVSMRIRKHGLLGRGRSPIHLLDPNLTVDDRLCRVSR